MIEILADFVRATTTHKHAPGLGRTTTPRGSTLRGLAQFLGLREPRAHTLDYPACAHSLSETSARCQLLSDYLLQNHEFLSLLSLNY